MASRTAVVTIVCLASPALADPPTDRNYAIELYDGVALGNTATIAMGGAATANAIGSAGTLINPAASAVRSTTDTDTWNWDYHLDAVSSSYSSDFDNNGIATSKGGTSAVTFGVAGRYHDWAAAITVSYEQAPLVDSTVALGGMDVPLHATTTRSILAVAKYVPQVDVAVGASLELAQFAVEPECEGEGCDALFKLGAGGAGLGAVWLPSLENFRVGASVRSAFRGGTVDASSSCDPNDCLGFVLPDSIVSPWRFATGVAYRFSDSPWNQLVGGSIWRDQRALVLVGDLVVTGASKNAYGLEAFGLHELQATGKHVGVSPRVGAEYEWVPGRLRVRAGSYWEPARYDEAAGRIHATFGIEARVFQFSLFGPRRGRITLTGDVASRYNNVGLSVGFWH